MSETPTPNQKAGKLTDETLLDVRGRTPDDRHYEPPCDVSGTCEPHEDEQDHDEAMCRFCGGWRRKDYPTFGNWGVPE